MSWEVVYLEEAKNDLSRLDGSPKLQVLKSIRKVSQNPVSIFDGGYGKPLGKIGTIDLTGCFKIKLKSVGIRVVYKLAVENRQMKIVIIGLRSDSWVYEEAFKRIN